MNRHSALYQSTNPFLAQSAVYRYGFNGKEFNEAGISGEGRDQDYGFRIYLNSIARFLSHDPMHKQYPMLSPYHFASNMPIVAVDMDGLEARIATYGSGRDHLADGSLGKQNHQTQFKKEAEKDIRWANAEMAYAVHTGELLVSTLKEVSKAQGGIEYLSIFSHSSNLNIILDNGQFGKESLGSKDWSGYKRMPLNDIFANPEIKWNPDALVVFAGCNAARQKYKGVNVPNIAESVARIYGIATIGADGYSSPSSQHGGNRKADFNYYLYYKDENDVVQKIALGQILNDQVIDQAKDIIAGVQKKRLERSSDTVPETTAPADSTKND